MTADSSGRPEGTSSVQSVDRALTILEILARGGPAGVTEISQRLGVHKSTAFRLLAALEAHAMVTQSRHRGTYELGFGIVRLAGATTGRLDLSKEGQAVCDSLAKDLGETVNVAIYDEGAAVNIVQSMGESALAATDYVGKRTPLHATSTGLMLLAHAPAEVVEGVLAGPLAAFTDRTVIEAAALRAELATTRTRGFSAVDQSWERGMRAVAVPVLGSDGAVVAALSVTGPVFRIEVEDFLSLAARLAVGATDLSKRLGFFG